MESEIKNYFREVSAVKKQRGATEFSYRTPLENLLRTLSPKGFSVVQEPSRVGGVGAPDFRVSGVGGAVVGYVECKKPGENLDDLIRGVQIKKYQNLSPNILLTDYQHFILLRNGAEADRTSPREKTKVGELLRRFFTAEPQKIGDAKTLAHALAERCRWLKKPLEENLQNDQSSLRGLFDSFQKTIYRDMDAAAFADALAQTLVYGLLMAKLNMKNGGKLELRTVKSQIPQNFNLLREIAGFLDELGEPVHANLRYLIDDILAVVNQMDAAAVAESLSYSKSRANGEDPYLHFYENFLAAYNPGLRQSRGVYYTPSPVARFIVRAADEVLREDFKLKEGLADDKVTALDFAAGTGTFMLEMFRLVFGDSDKPRRGMLAKKHLLKNFFGFELLLAPFAIAHLKLSQFLKDSGIALGRERVNVFLANTLEKISKQVDLHFLPRLAEEANRAQAIKDKDILVITGNPPYSVHSQTPGWEIYERQHKKIKGKTVRDVRDTWIGKLMRDYYKVDGGDLMEKNPKMLQDDYVKFIRFAQHKIDEAGEGVVAVITNHAFLDNPTFRGMRQSLLGSFNRLYFLDLHGNAKKQERTPNGDMDENIFDIQQGVAVSVFVKKPGLPRGVFRADMFGDRKSKYERCEEQTFRGIQWKEIKPASPFYLFTPWNGKEFKAYNRHWRVTDIFRAHSTGIKTHRDEFAFAPDRETILARLADMANAKLSDDDFQRKHNARETQGWKLAAARRKIRECKNIGEHIHLCACRPFDFRWCFHGYETMDRPRLDVMRHMLAGDNLGLVTVRQVAEKEFNHAMISDKITDTRMTLSNKGAAYLFPLYRFDKEMGGVVRRENFNPEFRKWIDAFYGKKHAPEKILGCIYALLHSPNYRRDYGEFLRMDFPRIPFPDSNKEFLRLANIGGKLMDAHLLRAHCDGKIQLRGEGTSNRVDTIHYDEKGKRLYFNKEEYYAPISPEVFNFQIGGYRPLDKFLKSRKGRVMTAEELSTLEKAANAVAFTLKKQKEIG